MRCGYCSTMANGWKLLNGVAAAFATGAEPMLTVFESSTKAEVMR